MNNFFPDESLLRLGDIIFFYCKLREGGDSSRKETETCYPIAIEFDVLPISPNLHETCHEGSTSYLHDSTQLRLILL